MDNSTKKQFLEYLNNSQLNKAYDLINYEYAGKPHDPDVLYHLGLLYRVGNDFKNAKIFLKKSIDFNPKDFNARYLLGIIYQLEGNFQKSVQLLNKAIEKNPYFYLAYNSLGLTFKKNQKHNVALKYYFLAQRVFFKKILKSLKEYHEDPSQINFNFVNTQSSNWTEITIDVLKELTAEDGLKSFYMPTTDSIYKHLESKNLSTDPWRDDETGRYVNFNVLGLVYNKLINDTFYCTICSNITTAFLEIGDYEEARNWVMESIDFIPEGYEYDDPYIALDFLESLK